MTPEVEARTQIDALLRACGWEIQDYKALNLGAAKGIAVRGVPLKSGRCDYRFAKKISYRVVHDVTGQPVDCEQLIREPSAARSIRRRRARTGERGGARQFRLSSQLRIAVTMDSRVNGSNLAVI